MGKSARWIRPPLLFAGKWAGLWACIWIGHYPLLRLPYYWDEAGYYIPAAYDFFRTGSLIPFSTLSNAHPPLPSIYLALWWKIFGFAPLVTRTSICLVSALALAAVWKLSLLTTAKRSVALATTLLIALYPVYFAQSSLAHADIFAAAATLWALVFLLDGRKLWAAAFCFALAALSKETAIVTPLALALWQSWLAFRERNIRQWGKAAWLALPALPLMLWYLYHWLRTGFIFGNPEYLRYNATATLTPVRILLAFAHRLMQVTLHMNLFVPVLTTLACMLLPPEKNADGTSIERISFDQQAVFYVVIAANVCLFSVLGGALLTRYLLPLYPLILLLCVNTFRRRLREWPVLVVLSAAAFLAGLFVNPPYRFAPEDNLEYATVIRLHQQAIGQIVGHYPGATVLTAWPATDELQKPELGYVTHPVPVVAIDNFSASEIRKAATLETPYTVGFVFSTKYDPPRRLFSLGPRNEAFDRRYFDFHRDLPPFIIAKLLDGDVVWRVDRKGQWAAVLHFDRPQWADLQQP